MTAIQFKIRTNRHGDQVAVHVHPEMVEVFNLVSSYRGMMAQGDIEATGIMHFGVRKGYRANKDGPWLAWLRGAERRYPNLKFTKVGFWWYEIRMRKSV